MEQDEKMDALADWRVLHNHHIQSIYLAGKVEQYNDWRVGLVDYASYEKYRAGGIVFDNGFWSDPEKNPDLGLEHWPVRRKAMFGRYNYTGPYVEDCGHGANDFNGFNPKRRAFVVAECLAAIARSELVFAWADDLTAYATLVELGYAKALRKRVWVAGPERFDDLWFLYQMADRVSFDEEDPCRALRVMLTRLGLDGDTA